MASPRNPDGFTGPDNDDAEFAWLAFGDKRGYDGSKQRTRDLDDRLDADPNFPDIA